MAPRKLALQNLIPAMLNFQCWGTPPPKGGTRGRPCIVTKTDPIDFGGTTVASAANRAVTVEM